MDIQLTPHMHEVCDKIFCTKLHKLDLPTYCGRIILSYLGPGTMVPTSTYYPLIVGIPSRYNVMYMYDHDTMSCTWVPTSILIPSEVFITYQLRSMVLSLQESGRSLSGL